MTANDETTHALQGIPIVAEGAPRLHLVAHEGTENETRIRCRRAVTLIGSREHCKITLRHDKVSGVHAAVINDGSHLVAVDLVSRTGTLLNGLKLEHERLSHGDALSVGPWEFRVEIEVGSHEGNGDMHPHGLEPSPHVVALEHKDTGQILKPNRDACTIGRRAGCDIAITDNRVSRCHSLLLTYYTQPAIADLLSRNHTLVNGRPVPFTRMHDGDVITIGETSFIVRAVNALPDPASGNGKASAGNGSKSAERVPDLINIQETEGSQRWRVADSLDKVQKVARKG